MVVGFRCLLILEVAVVGAYQLDAILLCELYQDLVCFLLQGECLAVGDDVRVLDLMTLELQIIVIAKQVVIPLAGLSCPVDVAFQYL